MEGKRAICRRDMLKAIGVTGAAGLLAACGATPQPAATTAPTAAAAAPTAASTTAETILYWDPSTSDTEIARLDQAYLKFNERQSAAKVEVGHGKDEDAVLTAVAGGNPPDVFWRWSVNTYGSWISRQVIQDLTPFADASTLDWGRFVPVALESCKWRDKYYGMPLTSAGIGLLYWNKPMFEAAGLDPETPPKDLTELLQFSEKLTVRDASGSLSALGFHWNWEHVEWPAMFNANYWDATAEQITPTDPGIVESYEWVAAFYEEYGVDAMERFITGFPGGGYYGSAHPVCEDMVASLAGREWDILFMTDIGGCEPSKFGYTRMVTPAGHPDYPVTSQGSIALVIPTGAAHSASAWSFIEFLQSADIAGEICAGLVNTAQVTDATEMPAYRDNPVLSLCTELSSNVRAWPGSIPVAAEYSDELAKAYDLIIHGKADATQELQGVYDRVQPALDAALGK
ncbi:MAG: extracellular solute-binding protein [Anaerolineae bacterium]